MIEYQRLLSEKTRAIRIDAMEKMLSGCNDLRQKWTDERLKEGRSVDDDITLQWSKMVADLLGGWLGAERELFTLEQETRKQLIAATRKATRRKINRH